MLKPESAKVAISIGRSADGREQAIHSAIGAQAEQLIANAQAEGLPVLQDGERVMGLLREQGEEACIPSAIYELMAAVIDFAQELDEARVDPAANLAPAEIDDDRDNEEA